jgi:hypothetical protein
MRKRIAIVVAWAIVAICLAGLGVGSALVAQINRLDVSTLELGIAFVIYPIVGAIIIAQRPRNIVGRILVAIGFGTTLTYFSAGYLAYSTTPGGHPLPAAAFLDWLSNCVWPVNLGLGTFLLLLFPTGRLVSPRWRWIAWIGAGGLALSVISSAFMPGVFSGETTTNPYGIASLTGALNLANQVSGVLVSLLTIAAILSALWRFWRSREAERQQMKWFAFGAALLAAAIAINAIWFPQSNLGFAIGFGILPLSIGIAVVRYRLYDIDLLINRALVYGALTAALAAVYFGVVIGSQALTRLLTGQGQPQQPVVIVLSTLLIAALFQPLRTRLQRTIDRRFYRRKYNAARTLAACGQTLRTEVEMESLCEHLVSAVEETMQPESVSLWLRARTPGGMEAGAARRQTSSQGSVAGSAE